MLNTGKVEGKEDNFLEEETVAEVGTSLGDRAIYSWGSAEHLLIAHTL